MALSVIAVSISVSPFFTEEDATAMFMTSAPSRLPASSNEDCVRVEGFEEQVDLGAAAQRRFLLLDLAADLDLLLGEVEQRRQISARESPSIPSRWRWGKQVGVCRSS